VTSVSVVIATADRPGPLAGCLAAVAALDHPREALEVIVVDDAGSARPDPHGLPVRLLRGERGGPGAARNIGAAAAEGDLLAFTDDDCLPEPGWLRALCAAARPDTMIGGRTLNALPHNRFAAASQHIQDLVYAHYNRDPEHARFFATNNVAVPRDAFLALGGFDVASFPFASEDRDLCDRWRASGRGLRSAPDAIVRHAHDLDLRGFVRQHVAYGRGAARYHQARARRGTGRLRDEAAFHLDTSLWLRTARLRPAGRAAGMVPLLALWQAANAAGYLLERRAG
jgi:GT2 family glycosyltransferase